MLAQNDPEGAPADAGQPKEVEKKTSSKLVRLMTVMAYLMSVSMAAILLSIYYLCIWKSPVLSDLEMEPSEHHQDAETFEYQRAYIDNDSIPYNLPGGSSTTMNDTDVQLPSSSIPYPDVHEPNEVIDTSVTEPTHSNSTFPYNGTTEAEAISTVTTVPTANDRTTHI